MKVYILRTAQRDIREIYEYVALHDSLERAEHVYQKIQDSIKRLGELPNRGVYPKELAEAGIKDFREVFFKPYRIIYEVGKKGVYVHLVADGRRNIQALLKRRLLGG